jgi:hypothetical protein
VALPSNPHLIDNQFVGFCQHDYILPPAIPTMYYFIDFDVVNGITGLFAWPTAAHGFPPAKRPGHGEILDMGLPMEGRSTDATLIVPHVPMPPVPSYLLPLIILLGSSKIIMGSNKTRIWCRGISGLTGEAEQAVGCCIFPHIPMSLNLQCWDLKCKTYDVSIGAPMMSDVVFAPNTVQVGISFSDYLAAMIDWAIDVLLAVFLAFGMKGLGSAWAKHQKISLENADRLAREASESALAEASEKGLSKEAAEESARVAGERARAKATDSIFKPVKNLYGKIAAKPAGKQWLIGLGLKVPYRLLVQNTEWYREKVKRPIENIRPEN